MPWPLEDIKQEIDIHTHKSRPGACINKLMTFEFWKRDSGPVSL